MTVISNLNSDNRPTSYSYILSFFGLLFLAVCLTSAFNVIADDQNGLEEWHYTLRPGDTVQEISLNLLNHQYSWSDVIKYNRVDQQATLAPGSIIKIPMHWLKHQPKPAQAKSLDGVVQIKKASSSRFELLKQNMLIQVGDEVATRDGNVLIEFADGSTIRLEANSNLVFNKLSHFGKTGMVDTRLRLKNGSLSTDIPPLVKGSRYEIKTPSAVAAVRGTEFRLHSTEKETRLEVLEGVVEFTGEHGQIVVEAGKGATITSQSPRIEVIDLPDPPTQYAQETIKELPVNIEWEKSKDAAKYQVQLTEKDKNGKLVQQFQQADNKLTLDAINNGNYELAVRSINNQGYEGEDSVSQLSVEIGAVNAQLIAPADASIIEESRPTFTWQYEPAGTEKNKNSAEVLSRLDIAIDQDFSALITENAFIKNTKQKLEQDLIPNRYFWRVATLTNNTQLTFSESRIFNIKGWLAPVQILTVNYIDKQVGLFWSPVANAEGYILQVSDKSDFSNIMKEEKLTKPRAHLLLNVGQQYYARVKGISNDLYSSKFGPVQELFIAPN